jgi:hypothetical protein
VVKNQSFTWTGPAGFTNPAISAIRLIPLIVFTHCPRLSLCLRKLSLLAIIAARSSFALRCLLVIEAWDFFGIWDLGFHPKAGPEYLGLVLVIFPAYGFGQFSASSVPFALTCSEYNTRKISVEVLAFSVAFRPTSLVVLTPAALTSVIAPFTCRF